MVIHVYTDGSCVNNGKANAKAGYGVWFGDKDPRNTSGTVKGKKQTNNVGELTGILKALQILKDPIKSGESIVIHTDSKYGLLCCTTYAKRMSEQNWLDNKGNQIPNKALVEKIWKITKADNIEVRHVKAHTGLKDKHSIGNQEADKLANEAVGQSDQDTRVYLKIPFKIKDQAKELGARWNPIKKKWYTTKDSPNFKALLKLQSD